tara:strand:+ start:420 stop:1325 length:906 start_codon:yes stop_codon:yes gene_type:complete
MKKFIYNIIKYPLILIFIKTPLINILKKRFKFHRFLKSKNIFWFILDVIFQKEYFNKLKDKKEIRKLTDLTLSDGEGRKWAEYYFNKHFKTLDNLKKKRVGTMSGFEASPIFDEMIKFIEINILNNNQDTYIVQLGSSSGRDLEFFLKKYPKLNYISTDVNEEILNFQRENYNYHNLKFFKCYAEDIDLCIENFNLHNKNLILFSFGSLQYVNPFFLEEFFLKLNKLKKLNLFIEEPVSLNFIDHEKLVSDNRANISFSHRYNEYVKNTKINIIKSKVIRPYSKEDKYNAHTGHFYLHASI